jgi:Ca2+-transporting ATPase
MPNQNFWHTKEIKDIFEELSSSEHGLGTVEATKRLQKYGPNKFPEGKTDSLAIIFLRQFQNPLIYILLVAAVIIWATNEIADAVVVMAVLIFNAIVGTIQEGKAQNTLLALKQFAETTATVMRDGKELVIPDTEVVPGDIIILQEGEKVPADARIIFSNTLKIDEASLTGESEPVTKTDKILPAEFLPTTDRKNMVFKGTHVLSGNGTAIVIATGLATEIGQIAKKIAAVDTEIPLKADIRRLSHLIIIAVFLISVFLIIIGVMSGNSLIEMFTTAVAMAISIIPEGLPVVVTLVLATGMWRMSKRNALVKRLQAVEALGQTKIIAVDKTGTLTKNEMVIQKVYIDEKTFEITGNGYEPTGEASLLGKTVDPLNHPELVFSGKIAAFCANARLSFLKETNTWKIAGDPTEAAMLVLSEKIGFHHDTLEKEMPKIFELPFDYQKNYHLTIRNVEKNNFLTIVGAPEKVLELCKNVWHKDGNEDMDEDKKTELKSIFHKLAQDGLRVLAYAVNPDIDQTVADPNNLPTLSFVGFFAMKDALRPEVKSAVQRVKSARIKVVMITGDHRLTAMAIAKEAGIYQEGEIVITGEEIDKMSDTELMEKISRVSVFARVTPDHKLRIVLAYRKRGEIVAMTGDGVNDAASLVAADLGVAMGKIGTEVAKSAADIVLLDDNFGSIVSAVEEGRSIYKTIKKVILYLFSTNLGETFTIIGALLLGLPLPLLPIHIIWLNFVTDGFLDVSLAMEPKEENLLSDNFERPKKYLIDKLMMQRMALMAIPMTIGALYLFKINLEHDLAKTWTISLTTLAVFQWFNAWNCRHESKSIFQMNPLANKWLIAATITIISLQLLAIYNPFMQKLLRTSPLQMSEWLTIIPIAASIILIEEIRKFFYRRELSRKRLTG